VSQIDLQQQRIGYQRRCARVFKATHVGR
jgi:hypothetical protein